MPSIHHASCSRWCPPCNNGSLESLPNGRDSNQPNSASLLRPNHALILLRHWTYASEQEPLHPLTAICLRRVDVPLRVRRNAVDRIKRTRLTATVSERREDLQRVPLKNMDLHVRSVGNIQ